MRILWLILAVVVWSNQLSARVPQKPSSIAVQNVMTAFETVIGANRLKETDMARIAQVILDPFKYGTDLRFYYSNGDLKLSAMDKLRDQQGRVQYIDNVNRLLLDKERAKVIEQFASVNEGDGEGWTMHMRGRSVHISKYEIDGEGRVTSNMLEKLLSFEEDGTIKAEDNGNKFIVKGGNVALPNLKYIDTATEGRVDIVPFFPLMEKEVVVDKVVATIAQIEESIKEIKGKNKLTESDENDLVILEDTLKELLDSQVKRDESHLAAVDGLIGAMESEPLVWPNERELTWEDFIAYVDSGVSSRVLVKREIGDNKKLLDKFEQYFAREGST